MENNTEQIKQAKRLAGGISMQLDRMTGADTFAFGKMMDSMMISAADVATAVNPSAIGKQGAAETSREEMNIFMSAGMDTSASRSENIDRLCDYFGLDTEEECREELEAMGMNIENLLGRVKSNTLPTDELLDAVEQKWSEILDKRFVAVYSAKIPSANVIKENLEGLYKKCAMREKISAKLEDFIKIESRDAAMQLTAEYLSMLLNDFVSTFGYNHIPQDLKEEVLSQNEALRLNIRTELLETAKGTKTGNHELLTGLPEMHQQLSSNVFDAGTKALLEKYPRYARLWQWQQQMRLAIFCLNK